jgi:serine/threonine protein kinase
VENTQVGPFLIIKKLGTNRRQRVYHARQTEQNRDVALKFISLPPEVEWSKALGKIELEVGELQKLKHPNLVKVYGAGVHDEEIFFANELIDGESLSAILSRRGKITPDLVVEYGRQIADVLRYLHHRELIHSKLNPEKILITPDHKVKIADLRLNRSRRRRWDSRRHRELDIAAYMAPEQFTDGATHKSDLYSLGVILFEMLTGKLPYEPDTMGRMTRMKMNAPVPSAATHVMNCPIWLDKIITQMRAAEPSQASPYGPGRHPGV